MRTTNKNRQLTQFLIIFILITIGFFVPVSNLNWIGFFIKGIIFVSLLYYSYLLIFSSFRTQDSVSNKKSEIDTELNVSNIEDSALSEEDFTGFGKAFRNFATDYVRLIKNASGIDCVALYLQKGNEGLEFQVGVAADTLIDTRLMITNNSLVYEVLNRASSVLETNLPIGITMGGLHQIEIRSFLGVPMIHQDEIVGVLAMGSCTMNDFRDDDIVLMKQREKLITQVMVNYHRGLRWEMQQQVYAIHLSMEKKLLDIKTEESVINIFVQEIKRMFLFDRFTLCLKEAEEGVVKYVYGQIDDIGSNFRFPLNDGLVGWVMRRNCPLRVEDINKGDYNQPRYSNNEDKKHGLRSFLIIPLSTIDKAWGCITLESRAVNQYSENAKDVLMNLTLLLVTTFKRINKDLF
ncbi:MAG: GAF domain-containing protein [bacterium]